MMNERLEMKVEPKQRLVLSPLRNEPLELIAHPKTKLVLSPLGDEFLLEILMPANLRDGHGWHLCSQIKLEAEHIETLRSYLAERTDEH
jgi:hypothetical protein